MDPYVTPADQKPSTAAEHNYLCVEYRYLTFKCQRGILNCARQSLGTEFLSKKKVAHMDKKNPTHKQACTITQIFVFLIRITKRQSDVMS